MSGLLLSTIDMIKSLDKGAMAEAAARILAEMATFGEAGVSERNKPGD